MRSHHLVLVGTILFATLPATARAQGSLKDNAAELIRKVGVHGNMSVREPVDPDVTKGLTFGPSIGLSPGRTNGWTYPIGLTIFSQDLHSPNGETFATVKTKAIMAGIGYGWHFGRLSTGASLQTGFALNNGQALGDMRRAFDVPEGAVSLHVGNSLLLRPQVKAEYFITPHITIRASADYIRLRPDIDVTTPTERIANWGASNAHANFGVGWYPCRK